MNLNLGALGVTPEVLEKALLSELGLSRKEAVHALANHFGVELNSGQPIKSGSTVVTEQGASTAQVITEAEVATLRDAAAISARIFSPA